MLNKGLIISTISGLSTMCGCLFMFNFKDKRKINKIVTISLSIAFIYMLLISVFDLFPLSLKYIPNKPCFKVFLYILINYTIIYIILKISHKISKFKVEEGKLYFLGIINMISLLLHNIPEGIITCATTNFNYNLGIKISLSIIMHNIPEGISIAVPIYYSTKSKKKGSIYTFLASLGEIIGALLSIIFFNNHINKIFIGYLMISISSIMILIALEEIFPKIYRKNKKNVLTGILIGILIFIINILLIK